MRIAGKEALDEIEDEAVLAQFRQKVDARSTDLTTVLLQDLVSKSNGKVSVTRISNWLARLGEGDKARETFLSGRSELVKQRVKQIGYEGDIAIYIGELAMVIFTLIKVSYLTFSAQQLFKRHYRTLVNGLWPLSRTTNYQAVCLRVGIPERAQTRCRLCSLVDRASSAF